MGPGPVLFSALPECAETAGEVVDLGRAAPPLPARRRKAKRRGLAFAQEAVDVAAVRELVRRASWRRGATGVRGGSTGASRRSASLSSVIASGDGP